MNRLKIRKMDSKTKHNLLGSYCSAIGFFNANGLSYGVAETIRYLKELSSLLTRAQRVRDELTDELLRAKALYVQSHPGEYTGFAYYPSLKDFKAMLKFSGKNYDDWVQEVNNAVLHR